MAHVSEVKAVDVLQYCGPTGAFIFAHAAGEVMSSGWSGIRLSPRFYATPPSDGIWEFDLEGHPPCGLVLPVALPATAHYAAGVPAWCKGVKVYAAQNSIVNPAMMPIQLTPSRVAPAFMQKPGHVQVEQVLVSRDDSFSVIDPFGGLGSASPRRLRHILTLVVEGPDEAVIRRCVAEAVSVGLVSAIVAVYAFGGGAVSAAISSFLAHLQASLGHQFIVRINDHAAWIEWCT